jgi:hypothetical protein
LHRAFRQAQGRHPSLRISIQIGPGPGGTPRFEHSDAPIKIRTVDRSEDTQWQTEAEAELAAPFDTSKGPLLRACLVRGGAISELILATHHSIGDGLSAMYLVRDLLEAMEGHPLEELPLRPSMEDLAGATPMRMGTPPAPPPPPIPVERPGVAKIASTEINPDQLEAVLARCHTEETTLQGALLAAILLEGPIDGCLSPVNVRHLCPPVTEDFGAYISSGTALLDRAA